MFLTESEPALLEKTTINQSQQSQGPKGIPEKSNHQHPTSRINLKS